MVDFTKDSRVLFCRSASAEKLFITCEVGYVMVSSPAKLTFVSQIGAYLKGSLAAKRAIQAEPIPGNHSCPVLLSFF